MNKTSRKIVVAITGASGSIYAQFLLKHLFHIRNQFECLSIVMSNNAPQVWEHEIDNNSYHTYDNIRYENQDFNAPFASGSAGYDTMVIIPCSMGVLGRIASGVSNDLITRAADVMLKERRKLICVPREAPYNLIHIRNMEYITLAGGIICPATPSFYHKPKSIEQCILSIIERIIKLMNLEIASYKWGEGGSSKN